MIQKVCNTNENMVTKLIADNSFLNPYLFIDTQTYGYNSENVKTDILCDDNFVYAILLQYYNTLQIMQIRQPDKLALSELLIYIENMKPKMISGDSNLIYEIASCLSFTNIEVKTGAIIDMTGMRNGYSHKTVLAETKQFDEIAKLICSDETIGSHYTVPSLTAQLIERNQKYGCVSRVLSRDGKIVAHVATYADNAPLAILGGLITLPEYRGNGYGKIVLGDLVEDVIMGGKTPLLYTYESSLKQWYISLGGKQICECAKIEFGI